LEAVLQMASMPGQDPSAALDIALGSIVQVKELFL
jgi:hypothetical protein